MGIADRLEKPSVFGFWTNGSSPRELAFRMNNTRYVEVGRWNERLRKKEAVNGTYILHLPFRQLHPERELDLLLDGELTAHVSVQGQGLHELTHPVQLRRFSPVREELQLNRGQRYFPDEYTAR
jgi:hypothetical protein